jgi:hypothetical protein
VILESSPAATVPDVVPTFCVEALPKPKLVLAVVALFKSLKLLAARRVPVRRESSPAATVPAVVPTFLVAEFPNPKLLRALATLLRSDKLDVLAKYAVLALVISVRIELSV